MPYCPVVHIPASEEWLAITAYMGWRPCYIEEGDNLKFFKWIQPKGVSSFTFNPPKWDTDLNVARELEERLVPSQWPVYLQNLQEELNSAPATHPRDTSPIHATALQRCRAFIRTLNIQPAPPPPTPTPTPKQSQSFLGQLKNYVFNRK